MDLKSIMEELKSITNEIKTLNDKIDGQSDNVINWMQFLENKTTSRLIKIDETMCKSANSINVIVRLLAVSTKYKCKIFKQDCIITYFITSVNHLLTGLDQIY